MVYLNIKNINILIVLSFLCFGCALTRDFTNLNENLTLRQHGEQYDQLQKYIGKTSGEVASIFGKPQYIETGKKFRNTLCDEIWIYKKDKGVPLLSPYEQLSIFCFGNKKVVMVDN